MSREIIAYYEGVPLFSIQYEVLKALEEILGEPIPPVKDVNESSFGFEVLQANNERIVYKIVRGL